MTHDDLTARLRSADHDMDPGWPAMALAANRLDRYRELLTYAALVVGGELAAPLVAEIREAIK